MEEITEEVWRSLNPLAVSVRSGAFHARYDKDTILNLESLNEDVVRVLAKSPIQRWAWDCYRRFIRCSDVVMESR